MRKGGTFLKEGSPLVSPRLGHTTALTATGSHSLPWCRFATPSKNFQYIY